MREIHCQIIQSVITLVTLVRLKEMGAIFYINEQEASLVMIMGIVEDYYEYYTTTTILL